MISDEIGSALFILATTAAVIWAGRRIWRGIVERRQPEPETFGDDGGRPTVTPELRRAHELYKQWDAGDMPAPELGSGERAGGE